MPDDRNNGDDPVGYARPPIHTRFKKGQSGNPRGRPKSRKSGKTDISELLDEPIKVRTGGTTRQMSGFEVGFRQLAMKALNKDLCAIREFVKLCEKYDVMAPPPTATGGGVIHAPKGVDCREWLESVKVKVPIDEV
jgi:hypothetical protein